MHIRKAVANEAGTIVDFQVAMARETEDLALDAATVRRGVEAVFAEPTRGTYYVAEINGQVAGALLVTYEWSEWRNGTVWWIQSVYVPANYRGQGVYKAMYNYLKDIVLADDSLKGIRLYVEKSNHRATAVYNAMGMTDQHYNLFEWLK